MRLLVDAALRMTIIDDAGRTLAEGRVASLVDAVAIKQALERRRESSRICVGRIVQALEYALSADECGAVATQLGFVAQDRTSPPMNARRDGQECPS